MFAVNEGIGAADAGAGGAKPGSLEPAGCRTTGSATMAERASALAGIPGGVNPGQQWQELAGVGATAIGPVITRDPPVCDADGPMLSDVGATGLCISCGGGGGAGAGAGSARRSAASGAGGADALGSRRLASLDSSSSIKSFQCPVTCDCMSSSSSFLGSVCVSIREGGADR